jgi:hypothetical protein
MVSYSIIIIYFLYFESATQDIFEMLKYCMIPLGIGFGVCWARYFHVISKIRRLQDRSQWLQIFLNSHDESGKSLEDEKKSRVFSNIFGFLASLAITAALGTYYDNFINNLPFQRFSLFIIY